MNVNVNEKKPHKINDNNFRGFIIHVVEKPKTIVIQLFIIQSIYFSYFWTQSIETQKQNEWKNSKLKPQTEKVQNQNFNHQN